MQTARWGIVVALLLLVSGFVGCKGKGLKIEEIDPPFGNVAGNDDVVIKGQGFEPGLVVHFRKRKASRVVIESDQMIRVKTPPGPEGPVDVVLIEPSGRSHVLENGFTYRKEQS